MDTTPRIIKIGDALSQLVNVALLPTHRSTTANESISGRAHRMGWAVRENRCIDAITAAVQAAGDRYWARFDAVQAATTVAQVNAVGW